MGARAEARARGYAVLSVLFGRGPSTEVLEEARLIEGFEELSEEALPELRATHYSVFGLSVFAMESAFIPPGDLLSLYAAGGFEPDASAAVDGVDSQLAALAAFSRSGATELSRALLSYHLLRWLPALSVALVREGQAPFDALAQTTLELCLDHASELGLAESALPVLGAAPELSAAETGLGDIADFLLEPARAGLFLSRHRLRGIAQALDLPRGFGSRRIELLNLFRAAGDYGCWEALMGALDDELRASFDLYGELASEDLGYSRAWKLRLSASREVLKSMSDVRPHRVE